MSEPKNKSEPMADDARRTLWVIIGATVLSVAANVFQTHTQLQVMEEKLLGVERSQDLKIDALRSQDGYTAQKLNEVGDKLGKLETMFYIHASDNNRHVIKP
jgi:hypothetical protein